MPSLADYCSDESTLDDASIDRDELCPVSHLLAFNASELVDKLCRATLEGQEVSIIRAQDCGIAFLATTPTTSSLLRTAMRRVRSVNLRSDIVSNSAYSWGEDGLACLPYAQRRLAFSRAICQGLLARFLASAEDLEDLSVNLFCHEVCHLEVAESDLEDFLGNQRWHRLSRLDVRGLLTSEQQLLDFIARHQDTLQHLTVGDIVFKTGTPASFFRNLQGVLAKSQLVAENFQLRGCFRTWTGNGRWGLQWLMEANDTPNQWLIDQLTDFVFGKGEWQNLIFEDDLDIAVQDERLQG